MIFPKKGKRVKLKQKLSQFPSDPQNFLQCSCIGLLVYKPAKMPLMPSFNTLTSNQKDV